MLSKRLNPLISFALEGASKTVGEVAKGVKAAKAVKGGPEVLQLRSELSKVYPGIAAALGIATERELNE